MSHGTSTTDRLRIADKNPKKDTAAVDDRQLRTMDADVIARLDSIDRKLGRLIELLANATSQLPGG